MDFNRALVKVAAWLSTAAVTVTALYVTKEPLCLFALIFPLIV